MQPDMQTAPLAQQSRHYHVVAKAIRYLSTHVHEQPSLEALAAAVHLSPFHLQRLFSRWAGLTPKRFVQFLSKEYACAALARSANLDSVAAAAGLSGTSRLHDLMLTCEAMTPAEVRAAGAGQILRYGLAPSPFGAALLAWNSRGLCHLEFAPTFDDESALWEREGRDGGTSPALRARWPHADLLRDDAGATRLSGKIFLPGAAGSRLHLVLRGSNFQIKVWEALMRTEPGSLLAYGALARRIGMPKASRAVGSAVAQNALAYLIPCHRVIRESGDIGQYRWGGERKRALLAWEASLSASAQTGPERLDPELEKGTVGGNADSNRAAGVAIALD